MRHKLLDYFAAGRKIRTPRSAPGKRYIVIISLITLFFALLLNSNCNAQENTRSDFGVGIGGVVMHSPQESELSDTGGDEDIDKIQVFFDWSFLRVAINVTNARLKFREFDKDWSTHLHKVTTYVAYRLSSGDGQAEWNFHGMAGLVFTDAKYTIENATSHSSGNLGYMVGGGALYNLDTISIGPEVLIIQSEGDFDGVKIATGSTQILAQLKYNF